MRSIGIRELRQRASEYLRAVERGETFEVTDRGRPVALLIPATGGDPVSKLTSQGRLSTADVDLLDLGPPLVPVLGVPTVSATLAAMRDDER